ncbi:O-antigen/teichoic acid export membrane protein [Peribacillus sp. B2I2]|uniref:lipopolysaccharide biosynthesis protein n=1 Tax=Peribacillus sp. B2I2 TaxID=3156468 RepID=UPI00351228ED
MRARKSFKNIAYSFSFSILNIILSFVARSAFLYAFDAEYLGLTTIVMNIIGVLSLTELGVTTAIGYALYKHLNEKNYNKINELMKFIKISYGIIGALILILGLLFIPFFNLIFTSSIDYNTIVLTYILYLLTTAISYFFTFKQVLIISDQNAYVVTNITGIIRIVRTIAQLISAVVYQNFMIWIILELVGNMLTYIIINREVSKKYSWLNLNINKSYRILLKENKEVLINLKNIIFHRLSGTVSTQTDSIIISIVATARDIALYANYLLIVNGITNILAQLFNGLTASIGNLIADSDNKKSYNIFQQLYHLEFYIGVCVTYILYRLVNPFIEIWIGEEFLFSNIFLLIICINFFIQVTRRTVDFFKDGYGIFYDIYAPILQAMLNLIISIILGKQYGIIGVYIGTMVSSLPLIVFWRPYILYKSGFKITFSKYLISLFKLTLLSILAIAVSEEIQKLVNFQVNSWISLIFYALITSIVFASILFLLFMTIKSYRKIVSRLINTASKVIVRK